MDVVTPLSCSFVVCICHCVNWHSRRCKQSTSLCCEPSLGQFPCAYVVQCAAYTHAHTHMHACVHMHTHTRVHTYTRTCTHAHAHTHTHIHTHTHRMDSSHSILPVRREMMRLWRCSFRVGLQWTCRTRWRIVIMIHHLSLVVCYLLCSLYTNVKEKGFGHRIVHLKYLETTCQVGITPAHAQMQWPYS